LFVAGHRGKFTGLAVPQCRGDPTDFAENTGEHREEKENKIKGIPMTASEEKAMSAEIEFVIDRIEGQLTVEFSEEFKKQLAGYLTDLERYAREIQAERDAVIAENCENEEHAAKEIRAAAGEK
jgi:hypothetical protein